MADIISPAIARLVAADRDGRRYEASGFLVAEGWIAVVLPDDPVYGSIRVQVTLDGRIRTGDWVPTPDGPRAGWALIRVRDADTKPSVRLGYPQLLGLGDKILVIAPGDAVDKPVAVTTGVVSRIARSRPSGTHPLTLGIEIDRTIRGALLLNGQGEVIGLVSGPDLESTREDGVSPMQHVGFAIPFRTLATPC